MLCHWPDGRDRRHRHAPGPGWRRYCRTGYLAVTAALPPTDQVPVLPQRVEKGHTAVQLQLASDTRCLSNHGSSLLQAVRSTRCAERPVKRCWTDARSEEEPVLNGRRPVGRPPSPAIRAEEH